jgi:histone H3/H4
MAYSITVYFTDEEFQKIIKKYDKDISKFRKDAKEKVKAMLEEKS